MIWRPLPIAALTLLLLGSAAGAQPHLSVPGELIVGVAPGVSLAQVDEVLARHACVRQGDADGTGMLLVSFDPSIPVAQMASALEGEPEIAYAHPNFVGGGGSFVPDDTLFRTQWHHANAEQTGGTAGVDLESLSAWDMTRGSPAVTVAVLDTGIERKHPEFAGRLVPGFDFVNEDADPEADHGHGVLVAGLLGANGDNAFGVAGVDHFCRIQPVKVLGGDNLGTTFDLIQGLNFAAGADIIAMSLVDYPDTPALQAALQRARDAGSILIACAGNGGVGDADRSFPGASPLTISIGATDHNDARASFSGTGAALDLVAPAAQSATVAWKTRADTAAFFSGCSAATPVAAGVAALALSIDPTLGHAAMRQLLIDGAEDQVGDPAEDTPGRDDFYGFGRINARRTLCQLDRAAPGLVCPSDAVAECSQPGGARAADAAIAAFLAGASASDDLDHAPALAHDAPDLLPMGPSTVTFTSRDECEKVASCSAALTVVDATAPTLACPPDLVVECNAFGGVAADDPALAAFLAGASAADACDSDVAVAADAPEFLGLGATPVTFTATDEAGNRRACVATVQVRDTTAPTLSVSLDPPRFRPAGLALRPVAASVTVEDVCDPAPGLALTSVRGDLDRGRGNGRSGRGRGRVYSVTYTAKDRSGNTATATATTSLGHERR
jgi:hypothetical protein